MGEVVTLEIPEHAARYARAIAAKTNRRFEDVLSEWIDQSAAEVPVESLADSDVLRLADVELSAVEQNELSALLALNRESELTPEQHVRFDALMQLYRRSMVRKAEALKVAVQRGLRPPLG